MGYNKGFGITGSKTTNIPTNYIIFDSETIEHKGFNHAYYVYARRVHVQKKKYVNKGVIGTTNMTAFWDWVIKRVYKYTKTVLFAHFALYDFLATDGHKQLIKAGFKHKFSWENGRSMGITYILEENGKTLKTIQIINTGNYFGEKLADLGKSVGITKGDFDLNKAKNFVSFDENDNMVVDEKHKDFWEMKKYCEQDVLILRKVMEGYFDFIKEHQLGKFAFTVAAQAMNAFTHRFMDNIPKIMFHDDEEIKEKERISYKGGRTSCFQIGEVKQDAYILDINSMYPGIMGDYKLPYAVAGQEKNISLKKLKTHMLTHAVIAEVTVNVKTPCVSIKIGSSGKVLYPVGTFRAFLTSPELELLEQEKGEILSVHSCIIYKHGVLFKEYVEYFYNLRQGFKKVNKKLYEKLCKMFLNSLYGKFAQWKYNTEEINRNADKDILSIKKLFVDGKPIIEKIVGGVVTIETDKTEHSKNFIPIASFITAFGRCNIFNLIKTAGFENTFYCDTDSVFCNKTGYENLQKAGELDNNILGKLKLENGGHVEGLNITTHKHYDYLVKFGKHANQWKNVKKGIRGDAKLVEGEDNTYEQVVFKKVKSNIKNGNFNKKGYASTTIIKKLSGNYNHGYVLKTGRILPLVTTVKNGFTEVLPFFKAYPHYRKDELADISCIERLNKYWNIK